jgi:hypothetical protein
MKLLVELGDQLVWRFNTSFYVNMAGNNVLTKRCPENMWNMTGNCKVISKSSNIHSKRQLTIIQPSYQHFYYVSDIYNTSTQKQAPFIVTPPRHGEAQDLEGGYVTLCHAQDVISTSETLVQIGM